MRTIIFAGFALLAGCATPPEPPVRQGDTIPIDSAPAPGELKVEHHRFSDDVIPGAIVVRDGYTPSILISDPSLRSASLSTKPQAEPGRSEQGLSSNKQSHEKGLAGLQTSEEASVCPASAANCVLAEIYFGLDRSEMTPEGEATLKSLDVRDKSLELVGYADSVGEQTYNGKLALARADSVRRALLYAGAAEVVVRAGHEAKFSGPRFRKVIIVGL